MKTYEIKFRVWNGTEMVYDVMVGKFGIFYVNPLNNGIDENDSACLTPASTKYPDDILVMQYTGLKDKNGVEIYEGDIIEFVTFTEDTVVAHVWTDEHACLHPFFDPFYIDDEQGAGLVDETIKVIGNIHDNPELLKQMP